MLCVYVVMEHTHTSSADTDIFLFYFFVLFCYNLSTTRVLEMAEDDDLGSFFSELQQVEEKIHTGELFIETEPPPVVVEKVIAAPVVQVVAKPQVIEKSARIIDIPTSSYEASSTTVMLGFNILCDFFLE